jgi:hypothetical protein
MIELMLSYSPDLLSLATLILPMALDVLGYETISSTPDNTG